MFEDIIKDTVEYELKMCILPNGTLWANAHKYCEHYKADDKEAGKVFCEFFDNAYTCSNSPVV